MPPDGVAEGARAASGAGAGGVGRHPGCATTRGRFVADAGVPAVARDAATAPAPAAVAAAPASSAPSPVDAGAMPSGVIQLRATAASWVEVTDSRGQSLISRVLKPGEAVALDGVPPLRVRIGNAAGTQLVFRGQPTDLTAFTRDNVARLELR